MIPGDHTGYVDYRCHSIYFIERRPRWTDAAICTCSAIPSRKQTFDVRRWHENGDPSYHPLLVQGRNSWSGGSFANQRQSSRSIFLAGWHGRDWQIHHRPNDRLPLRQVQRAWRILLLLKRRHGMQQRRHDIPYHRIPTMLTPSCFSRGCVQGDA